MPQIFPHAPGSAGVAQTMHHMTTLVNQAYLDPLIQDQAALVATHCPRGDRRCQCASLLGWVKRKVRYIPDPTDTEALRSPVHMARAIAENRIVYGDCDDFSMYLAALMKAIGLRPVLRAVGYNGGPFRHIYVTCEGMRLDATRDEWVQMPIGAWTETSQMEMGV